MGTVCAADRDRAVHRGWGAARAPLGRRSGALRGPHCGYLVLIRQGAVHEAGRSGARGGAAAVHEAGPEPGDPRGDLRRL